METASLVAALRRLIPSNKRYLRLLSGAKDPTWEYALKESHIEAHLLGKQRIGPLVAEGTPFLCFDFDGKNTSKEAAWADLVLTQETLAAHGLPYGLVEVSRSEEGFHLWLLLDAPLPPDVTKRFGLRILELAGLPTDEKEKEGHPGVYPHPPKNKSAGKSPFLPWCGILNGQPSGLFVNNEQQPVSGQIEALEQTPKLASVIVTAMAGAPPAETTKTPKAGPSSRHDTLVSSTLGIVNAHLDDIPLAWSKCEAVFEKLGLRDDRRRELDEAFSSACAIVMGERQEAAKKTVIPASQADDDFPLLNMQTILEDGDVEIPYIIDRFLSKGEISLVASAPGVGKSMVALSMAVAAACGLPVFGRFLTPEPIKVVYLNEEMGESEYRKRIKKLMLGMKADHKLLAANLHPVLMHGLTLRTTETKKLDYLRRNVDRIKPALLIFDTYASFFGGKESDATETRDWFRAVPFWLKAKHNCATCILHHIKKPSEEFNFDKASDMEVMFVVRGSGDLSGASERVFVLWKRGSDEHNDHGVEFRVSVRNPKARMGDQLKKFDMLVSDTDTDKTVVTALRSTKSKVELAWEQAVMEILRVNKGRMGYSSLAEQVATVKGKGVSTAYHWIKMLASEGILKIAPIAGGKAEEVILLEDRLLDLGC